MRHLYDMIIIGGGPGGYTAALYAARAGLDTLVLEKLSAGLSHKTKDFLKFLGASAAITSIGIGGGYLIGRKVGKKEGRKEGFDVGYTRGRDDGYFRGFCRGEEITLEGAHQKMLRLIQKNPDSDHAVAAIIAWFSKHGANG